MLVWNLKKSGQQIIIAGQENVRNSLLTKSNDEVLTASYTCAYLFLRLKLFLRM